MRGLHVDYDDTRAAVLKLVQRINAFRRAHPFADDGTTISYFDFDNTIKHMLNGQIAYHTAPNELVAYDVQEKYGFNLEHCGQYDEGSNVPTQPPGCDANRPGKMGAPHRR